MHHQIGISNIHGPSSSHAPCSFTVNRYFRVKGRPVLKRFIYFFTKSRTWKADFANIMLAVNNFRKRSIVDVWKCSEYTRVLNTPKLWICQCLNIPGFRIYQGSKYVRVTHGSEYAWISLNNSWIYLIMPEYVWICENRREYAWIYKNLPERLLLTESIWFSFLF